MGLIPGSGKSPGEGNGYPLQPSRLENPMDRGAWQTTVQGESKEPDTTKRLNTRTGMRTQQSLYSGLSGCFFPLQ